MQQVTSKDTAQMDDEQKVLRNLNADSKCYVRRRRHVQHKGNVEQGNSTSNHSVEKGERRKQVVDCDDEDRNNTHQKLEPGSELYPEKEKFPAQESRRRSERIAKLVRKGKLQRSAITTSTEQASGLEDEYAPETSLPADTREASSESDSKIFLINSLPFNRSIHVIETKALSVLSFKKFEVQMKQRQSRFSALYMKASLEEEERVFPKLKAQSRYRKSVLHGRPDLKVLHIMTHDDKASRLTRMIGDIPGITANQIFTSKAEMAVVGLHRRWMSGIDYIGCSNAIAVHVDYKLPLAVCIALAGRYEDDAGNLQEIVYTGEGGRSSVTSTRGRQCRHQRLSKGNLGLVNSMKYAKPVRVVRKRVGSHGVCYGLYTYLGLYQVMDFTYTEDKSGFSVFKFRLRRLPGQAPIERTPKIPTTTFLNETESAISSDSSSKLQE